MTGHDCLLCRSLRLENRTWVAAWDPFPVNIGHMKLIPKRHVCSLCELTTDEQLDFFDLLNKVIVYLTECFSEHRPDGYNVGLNLGEAAVQTMPHLHVHVIPRYEGDVQNPRGGVRNIKTPLVQW